MNTYKFRKELLNNGKEKYGTKENVKRACPKCKKPLVMDERTSGPWGTMWKCEEHGLISAQDIVYNEAKENAKVVKARQLKVGMIVIYDGEQKVTGVQDNKDGTYTIQFNDSGTEFDANDTFEVK